MAVDRIVEHWWDGKWAELFRRDIWLRTDGTTWTVEARQGNRHGVWAKTFDDEETARILVEAMKARSGDTWRDISPTERPRDEGKTA